MNCPMCNAEVIWREEWKLYECTRCIRRWLSWPPEHPVLILGWKGMQWDAKLQRAVPLAKP